MVNATVVNRWVNLPPVVTLINTGKGVYYYRLGSNKLRYGPYPTVAAVNAAVTTALANPTVLKRANAARNRVLANLG